MAKRTAISVIITFFIILMFKLLLIVLQNYDLSFTNPNKNG